MFFVQDPKYTRKELKVDWTRDLLDVDASLEEFASVYVRLFALQRCAEKRRLACLTLYRMFSPAFTATKECELSSAEPTRVPARLRPRRGFPLLLVCRAGTAETADAESCWPRALLQRSVPGGSYSTVALSQA